MVFLIFIFASAVAAAPTIFFRPGEWYHSLKKPSFTPPSWAFPVAWFVIYFCSSLSAARISSLRDNEHFLALWALQISLNTIWTPIFFGAHKLGSAMAVMFLLLFVVCLMTYIAVGTDVVSAFLLVPYILWLSLAAALNLYVLINNDQTGKR